MREAQKILRNAIGKGVYPHQMAWILDLPGRQILMSPKKVADRLQLKPDFIVLELGAGTGYYGVEVARRLPSGYLELFDLQQEMLEKAKNKVSAAGLHNVGYTQGNGANLPFQNQEFDVVFMVTVFGEISDQGACLKNIRRVLKPGGILSITEHHPDPDFSTLEQVRRVVETEGFTFKERLGWCWAFTANFAKE